MWPARQTVQRGSLSFLYQGSVSLGQTMKAFPSGIFSTTHLIGRPDKETG
jgi:hypothetical protein